MTLKKARPAMAEKPPERISGSLAHVSEILESLTQSPELSDAAAAAVRMGIEGHVPHLACPCVDCHRYFRSFA